ncbi:MAG: cytochrome c3 family protein, partial [Acidobacteriota bacterium]
MRIPLSRFAFLLALAVPAVSLFAQQPPPAAGKEFLVHAFHKDKLGGTLECSLCHVAVKEGSVTLKRPGHDQCITCHSDDFNKDLKQAVCAECHKTFPPTGAEDLVPFPRYQGTRAILFEFSHAKHVDQKARVDARTGFRADCTFCHKFDAKGVFATFPGHEQCASCHSKAGMKPQLTADLSAEGCRGCHTPEEIENPGFTEARRFASGRQTVSGKYIDIRFAHQPHFQVKEQFSLNCTTCHYEVPRSTSVKDLSLPKMLDCVQCHDSARAVKAEFQMGNCKTCHAEPVNTSAIPNSHTRNVKPDFHTEAFRREHATEAAAANA